MIADIRNGVRYYQDGREVCQESLAGRKAYTARRNTAAWKQSYLCGVCGRWMQAEDTTLDHINPRGMGGARRDDRQENLQAVHAICNSAKGSKRQTEGKAMAE